MSLRRTGISRRTPLKAKTTLARGGRVSPVSKRRRNRDKVYADRRRQVFDDQGGMCAFEYGDGLLCGNAMTDVHHLAGRVGDDPHRRSNLIGLCRTHHTFVHERPALARELGYMRSRLGGAA